MSDYREIFGREPEPSVPVEEENPPVTVETPELPATGIHQTLPLIAMSGATAILGFILLRRK